jgi:hypothetical protein
LVLFLLLSCTIPLEAATLHNAVTEVMTRLGANLQARGEIVARLENDEVVVEYQDDQVPSYGAELLVFSRTEQTPVGSGEKGVGSVPAGPPPGTLLFHGSISIRQSAGHLNLAHIDEGRNLVAAGDQVFLPPPVSLYIAPVHNLTPYLFLTQSATRALARLLKLYPRWRVYSLPATNRATVVSLQQQCRGAGRYGLVLQPLIVNQNGRFKIQLRQTSLFSGMSLNVLEAEFMPYAGVVPAAPPAPYRPQSPRPYSRPGIPSSM